MQLVLDSKAMDRVRHLDRACFENDRSLTKGNQEQPWGKQHSIGDNITEGQQGNPLTNGDLDVTESVLIENAAAGDVLRSLRRLGVRIAADDLGLAIRRRAISGSFPSVHSRSIGRSC